MKEYRAVWIASLLVVLFPLLFVGVGRWFKRSDNAEGARLPSDKGNVEVPARPSFTMPTAKRVFDSLRIEKHLEDDRPRIDPIRAMDQSDREYRLEFERHRAIKTWRGAPCAKHPDFDGVLIELLENGYGISEWPAAIRAITSWSEVEFHHVDQLRQLGVGEEDIPRERERYRNENLGEWKRCRAMLKATTGIEDGVLLDNLMNTPLHWPLFNDPLNTVNVFNRRGKAFLNDADWMEPRHLQARDRYEGEPRKQRTALEITELFADDVMLVNEYEAILDSDDIHPALSDYRGDDYYENKRRLDELGQQKVEMLRSK